MKHANDHAACSGCSLCLLVCPMWRHSRDISLSAHGFAKALQHGATVNDISTALWRCTLCGACDPVCPEQIDLTGMILKLRSQLKHPAETDLLKMMEAQSVHPYGARFSAAMTLLSDSCLREHPDTLARIADLLGRNRTFAIAEDGGSDIVLALEAGVDILPHRLKRFLAPLRELDKIVVADGLLLKHLKRWMPEAKLISLGEALSSHAEVRCNLHASDLYVIDSRSYHADYQRLVKYYDRLRVESGCVFNLDLQRIAVPATLRCLSQRLGGVASDDEAQTRWMLHGRSIQRIVVESMEDRIAIEKFSSVPVVHLAELYCNGMGTNVPHLLPPASEGMVQR